VSAFDLINEGFAPTYFLALAGGLIFGVRNLRLNRGDRRGAFRLASVIFLASALARMLSAQNWSPVAEAWHSVSVGVGWALWNSALAWVLYIAIEPSVRRRWPETLISWSRLLEGRFRDARVGRDVLIGVFCTLLLVLPFGTLRLMYGSLPAANPGLLPVDLGYLSGPAYFLAKFLAGVGYSVFAGLMFLVLLLLLRVVFRRHWATVSAVIALATLLGSAGLRLGRTDLLSILMVGVVAGGLFLLLMRVGLLALITLHLLFFATSFELPLTVDLSAWYGTPTLLFLVLVCLFTLYGFYVSMGGKPVFGESLLEE
jgi:serine/threonine-protein kinase